MIMSASAEVMLKDQILQPLLGLIKGAGVAITAIYKPFKAGDFLYKDLVPAIPLAVVAELKAVAI